MLQWKTEGTKLYQSLPADMKMFWKESVPLRERPNEQASQEFLYKTWDEIKRNSP